MWLGIIKEDLKSSDWPHLPCSRFCLLSSRAWCYPATPLPYSWPLQFSMQSYNHCIEMPSIDYFLWQFLKTTSFCWAPSSGVSTWHFWLMVPQIYLLKLLSSNLSSSSSSLIGTHSSLLLESMICTTILSEVKPEPTGVTLALSLTSIHYVTKFYKSWFLFNIFPQYVSPPLSFPLWSNSSDQPLSSN